MKIDHRLRVAAFSLTVLAYMTGVLVATDFLTAYLYWRIGQQPNAFWGQVINWIIGLLLSFSSFYIFGTMNRSKRWQVTMQMFGPIFAAMSQIAKGDFNVKLDNQDEDNPLASELTKRINNMALELNQLEAMRQEFISDVSHEIQSPLTSIRGFARALQNDELALAERSHYLTIIETESMRLSKLADNLLKLASLESKQVKFEPKPYRLDKQIRNLLLTCEPQWMDKAIQMEVALEEATISADEELLSQVWLNLIHNSIKFTPEGGKICAELHKQGDSFQFTLTDSGIGLSQEAQAHIFERFYKADKSRQRSIEGSGLGLSIVSKILEMHRGTIGVNSQLGQGASFTVVLPSVSAPGQTAGG